MPEALDRADTASGRVSPLVVSRGHTAHSGRWTHELCTDSKQRRKDVTLRTASARCQTMLDGSSVPLSVRPLSGEPTSRTQL